jgi:hypothetical protein
MFPDLFAENPASHLIWMVALGMFGVLAVILLVEMYDWVRGQVRRLAGGEEERPADSEERWVLREPDTELRRRYHRHLEPDRRTLEDGSGHHGTGRR